MMRQPSLRWKAADLIEQTTTALLDAIHQDAADNPAVMGAAVVRWPDQSLELDNPEMMLGNYVR